MNIKILHMIEGAKQATGVTVVIDVFRAFSVEAYLMNSNVKKIIPVGDMQIAHDYKKNNPGVILVGERHGRILPGFDFGNSPSQLEGADLTGKTVIHTTSAGTQGIANAKNADVILTGSLVNAKAVAKYICSRYNQCIDTNKNILEKRFEKFNKCPVTIYLTKFFLIFAFNFLSHPKLNIYFLK